MNYDYIIGIDGGGTKTKGILFNQKGEILQTAIASFSNFSVNEELSKEHIEQVIGILRNSVSHQHSVFIQLGIAGASKLINSHHWLESLESRFNAKLNLVNDAMIGMYSVDHQEYENVILVISGTGNAIMTKSNQKIRLFGGYGHLFGDKGSSYHIALEAIKKILEENEESKEISEFSDHLMRYMGRKERSEIIHYVYNGEKNTFSQLAKEISKLALKGDIDAIRLLENEGEYLANEIIRVHKNIKDNQTCVIAFRGGFIENAPYAKEKMLSVVEQSLVNYRLETTPNDPIIGAYRLGIINASKEVDV